MPKNGFYILKPRNNYDKVSDDIKKLNWYNLFFSTYLFIGSNHLGINRTMFGYLEALRSDTSIFNVYSLLFELKKVLLLIKGYSYKSYKYQKFYFLVKDFSFLYENKVYLDKYFFSTVNLNRNPGYLVSSFLNTAHKPRCLFYLSNKHGFSFLLKAQKLGVLNVTFNSLNFAGKFSNYLVPWNFYNYFSVRFLFFLIIFLLKRDRFVYFKSRAWINS